MESAGMKTFDIATEGGLVARADLYVPRHEAVSGIVVLCHGFKGHRRWGFIPELSKRMAKAGIAAMPFDFSHNGCVPGPPSKQNGALHFTHPDLFRRNTISREIDDLAAVIDYIALTRLGGLLGENAPVGLFGHSRGGFVALLHALERGGIRAICTWATVSDPNYFTDHQRKNWRCHGFYAFFDSGTATQLVIDATYLDDIEANADRYRLVERVHDLSIPHLLVHGKNDLVVPVESSTAIHQAETGLEHKRLVTVKTSHTFGCTESKFRPSGAFDSASDETVRWFQTHFNSGE